MGTRNAIVIKLEKKIKVANYNQWDGYPEGQGALIVDFLTKELDRDVFIRKLKACTFLTDLEYDELRENTRRLSNNEWNRQFPELSRDTGADILKIIQNSPIGLRLFNAIEFAKSDNVFCEYVYLLNFDSNTLKVYKGTMRKGNLIFKGSFASLTEKTMKELQGKVSELE